LDALLRSANSLVLNARAARIALVDARSKCFKPAPISCCSCNSHVGNNVCQFEMGASGHAEIRCIGLHGRVPGIRHGLGLVRHGAVGWSTRKRDVASRDQ
jgi:hypothetical protein